MPLWEDHLLPLLTSKDAARLGSTCKALRGVVREHFLGLGTIDGRRLKAALMTFPSARTVMLTVRVSNSAAAEEVVEWMREGGWGRNLESVRVAKWFCSCSYFVHEALQQGVLPSLRRMDVNLEDQRASVTGGFMGAMHELHLTIKCTPDSAAMEAQLAAVGVMRQLPALTRLELQIIDEDDDPPVEWPPFIPPSLKALRIEVKQCPGSRVESLTSVLPGMLAASGARLDRLELILDHYFYELGDGLVHLAQTLRCSSATIKGFLFTTGDEGLVGAEQDVEDEDYGPNVERLRVHWADVLAGVSTCRELQVLVLPEIMAEPLFPSGTAFARLTHLEISDHAREHPPDAGVVGLWEVMASGGLPALAKLRVWIEGRWGGGGEVRSRVAPAFEAVAGTLTHLYFETYQYSAVGDWLSDEVDVGYELGVAMGKLRRLKDLALNLSQDGRVYQAIAQGLTASGENLALPLLWRVRLLSNVRLNADLLASLVLPSVRVFMSFHGHTPAALLTACALRQAGYKHHWTLWCNEYYVPWWEPKQGTPKCPTTIGRPRLLFGTSGGLGEYAASMDHSPEGRLSLAGDEP
jgi:hypothetical protein